MEHQVPDPAHPPTHQASLGKSPEYSKPVIPKLFGTRDWFCERQFLHELWWEGMVSGLFKLLHLWCTLFLLLLLYQLHSRSSDIRPWRLQILALSFCKLFVEEKKGGGPHFPSFSSHKYKHLGFFSIHIGLYASSPIYSTAESGIYTGGWLTEASQGMIPPHPER